MLTKWPWEAGRGPRRPPAGGAQTCCGRKTEGQANTVSHHEPRGITASPLKGHTVLAACAPRPWQRKKKAKVQDQRVGGPSRGRPSAICPGRWPWRGAERLHRKKGYTATLPTHLWGWSGLTVNRPLPGRLRGVSVRAEVNPQGDCPCVPSSVKLSDDEFLPKGPGWQEQGIPGDLAKGLSRPESPRGALPQLCTMLGTDGIVPT